MNPAHRQHFAVRLASLAEVYGANLTPALLTEYFAALSDLPLEAVIIGMGNAAKTCRFFPRPVEIRELAGHGPPDVGLISGLVLDWLWGRDLPEGTGPFVSQLVRRLGGRRALEDMPAGVRFSQIRQILPGMVSAFHARGLPLPSERVLLEADAACPRRLTEPSEQG